MRPRYRLIEKRRFFSKEFKLERIGLFERGKHSVRELSIIYGIRSSVLYRWIYRYSQINEKSYRIVEMKNSSTSKIKELEQKVKDLERLVGQKQIKIDFLEEMINVAKEELKVDIKKKYSTSRSADSGK